MVLLDQAVKRRKMAACPLLTAKNMKAPRATSRNDPPFKRDKRASNQHRESDVESTEDSLRN